MENGSYDCGSIFFLLQIIKYNRTHSEMLSVGTHNLNLSSLIKIHFVDTCIKYLKLFFFSLKFFFLKHNQACNDINFFLSYLLKNAGAESKSK